jgi:alpha-glucosidase
MTDFGYDIADYYNVDPSFGTLDDFKELVTQAHSRGIRVMVDLVANHTSDEHAWFKESRASRDNPKRDWYFWRKGYPSGAPPNNWRSVFGGSAWEYDSLTSEFYLHSFSTKQPDLNWDNPEVRQAIESVVKFWLSLGADGFRADAVYWLSKDHLLRDDPLNAHNSPYDNSDYHGLTHRFSEQGPQLYNYLKDITDSFGSYGDRFLVAETSPESEDKVGEYLKFYSYVDQRRCAPFIFESIYFGNDVMRFKSFADKFQAALKPDYLPIYTLGNHDRPRLASRVGQESLRNMAMMLLCLPGMPFIYYGEEIGMSDAVVPSGQQKDLMAGNQARDGSRSPMQWDNQLNAGFSQGVPWMTVADSYDQVNVAGELADAGSLLNLYRSLIKLRNESPALQYGSYQPLELGNEIYGFVRREAGQSLVVILNFNDQPASVALGDLKGEIILSTQFSGQPARLGQYLNLAANQGVIIALDKV